MSDVTWVPEGEHAGLITGHGEKDFRIIAQPVVARQDGLSLGADPMVRVAMFGVDARGAPTSVIWMADEDDLFLLLQMVVDAIQQRRNAQEVT